MSAVSRRRLVALLAALTAFALQPGTAGRAGLNDTSNPDCPGIIALPTAHDQEGFEFTGGLRCFEPGSASFGGNVQLPPTTDIREAAPKLGDPCQSIYYHAVTFSEDTSPSGHPTATFPILGVSKGELLSDADAQMIAGSNAYVADTQFGTYELTNPTDPTSPLQCVLNGSFNLYCPTTHTVGTLCFVWQDNPFVVPDPPATVPPFFKDVLGHLNVTAGAIHSAPATRGVVNTPVCFWIDGMGIQDTRRLTLVLPGPVDASGREIFFTYLATIQFQGVTWQFDDPTGDNSYTTPATACQQGQSELVAHRYSQISDGSHNGDNTYHVTATENYSLSIVVYWYDSTGQRGPVEVDPGVPPPTLHPDPYAQYVGQVEGVPIGGQ